MADVSLPWKPRDETCRDCERSGYRKRLTNCERETRFLIDNGPSLYKNEPEHIIRLSLTYFLFELHLFTCTFSAHTHTHTHKFTASRFVSFQTPTATHSPLASEELLTHALRVPRSFSSGPSHQSPRRSLSAPNRKNRKEHRSYPNVHFSSTARQGDSLLEFGLNPC